MTHIYSILHRNLLQDSVYYNRRKYFLESERGTFYYEEICKVCIGGAALAGTMCGVVYFLQKVLGWDILKKKDDDDDFDDFDDDIDDIDDIDDDDDSDDREYVTLDMEEEDAEEKDEEPAAEDEEAGKAEESEETENTEDKEKEPTAAASAVTE